MASSYEPPRSAKPGERDEPKLCVDGEGISGRQSGEPLEHTHGRLPPEQIQALVRARYHEFGNCYHAGLVRNQQLAGKITVRFVIDTDGSVTEPQIVDNTLADCTVTACVRNSFGRIVFPPPEGGRVTVVYPVQFDPVPGNPPSKALNDER